MADESLKDWTIMVYMAGDNNLSENMAVALEEIRGGFGSLPGINKNQVNLLAFFDSSSLTAPTQYIDFSDVNSANLEPERHQITREDFVYPKRDFGDKRVSEEDLEEGNSSSAYSIMNFVNWCVKKQKRTAKNYAIIFSSHSFGFHGTSFLRDESSGGFITLFKFRWALEQIKKDCLKNEKISILGFDSCLMSMIEVGYELKEVAQTIVASEGNLPNSGWSYAPLLKRFLPSFKTDIQNKLEQALNNPELLEDFIKTLGLDLNIFQPQSNPVEDINVAPKTLDETSLPDDLDINQLMDFIVSQPGYIKQSAKQFVDALIQNHNNLLIGGRSIDIAAWDLEKIDQVALNINNLAKEFNKYLDLSDKIKNETLKDEDIIKFQELKKILLQSHYDTQTYMEEQCVDLKDFCKRLIIECKFVKSDILKEVSTKLIKLSKNVIKSVDECVLKSGFSGDEFQFSNGISLYFPWSSLTFSLTNFRYRYLVFSKGDTKRENIDEIETYNGVGKDWYLFLLNYLFRVTLRGARKVKEDGVEKISTLEDFSKENDIWSKANPPWSRANPIWSRANSGNRANPPWSRANFPWSRANFPWSKANFPWSRGEIGQYMFYFSRFKNFENQWDIHGFADEFKFEEDFDGENLSINDQENLTATDKEE